MNAIFLFLSAQSASSADKINALFGEAHDSIFGSLFCQNPAHGSVFNPEWCLVNRKPDIIWFHLMICFQRAAAC
jgi:hypothetical protein